eukprot:2066785-Prymnesium_polylepis.1
MHDSASQSEALSGGAGAGAREGGRVRGWGCGVSSPAATATTSTAQDIVAGSKPRGWEQSVHDCMPYLCSACILMSIISASTTGPGWAVSSSTRRPGQPEGDLARLRLKPLETAA